MGDGVFSLFCVGKCVRCLRWIKVGVRVGCFR